MPHPVIVSRDDAIYQAWPDVARTQNDRLVCVFSECTHHFDRSYTRIVCVSSDDRGQTWSAKRPVSDALHKKSLSNPHWNCARITSLSDGRLAIIADRVAGKDEGSREGGEQSNWLWFSDDNGDTWSGPIPTPVRGIVPDKLLELTVGPFVGRWIAAAHTAFDGEKGRQGRQDCWYSDDQGKSWEGPFLVASEPGLQLCEGSIMALSDGTLVCFLRENSGIGLDAFKLTSRDGGRTWEDFTAFPLPGCHRPVAGMLQSGNVLITYRFLQGGRPHGWVAQNFFAALTDVESCLADTRENVHTRILPLDYDRSLKADLGYSGWTQFPNGEIYIVYYIVDDAPKGHIRGISMREEDFCIPDRFENQNK